MLAEQLAEHGFRFCSTVWVQKCLRRSRANLVRRAEARQMSWAKVGCDQNKAYQIVDAKRESNALLCECMTFVDVSKTKRAP